MDYKRRSHSVYLLTYHIVFVTKYRKPCINDEISEFIKQHTTYLCNRMNGECLSVETDKDHVHLLVSLPPDTAPAEAVRIIKTQLSKEIHLNKVYDDYVKQFIYGKSPLWTQSYFIATTGGVVLEKIKQYIEEQKTDSHTRKYEKSGRFKKKRNKKQKS